ncbi:WD40 repeat domain-containing protein, partial [Candidatus Bathyarchaeota archaeon]|nr:WD40 repeat domain-containing protein [Candidatus Bathyarchaeota archaeon]
MPQYWVIDAIDECLKFFELFALLKGERPCFPLRIFITSRKDPEIRRLFRPFEATLTAVEIPVDNTTEDIKNYIASRMDELPIGATVDLIDLSKQILAKSGANFLWVRLVIDELRSVCADETIIDVLEDIPRGMIPYYERTVARMAEKDREKHISKAILLWVVTSARPIHTQELEEALELDINSRFSSMPEAIERLCGHLIAVNEHTDLVHVVHATAREFLQSKAAGEFRIVRRVAHERIALICLRVLSDRKLARPPTYRHLANRKLQAADLLGYAVTQFYEHVYGASSESDKLLAELDRFLKSSNILTLVELLSRKGTLQGMIQVAKNLSAYLDRREKYAAPLSGMAQVKVVEGWSVTLSRLVTKFGKALLSTPACVHFLIPPLCPTTTTIHEKFGKVHGGLSLVGFNNDTWDDCIAALNLGDDAAAAVTSAPTSIAVGMESGTVRLFHHRSFQQELVLSNKNPVDTLHFTESGKNFASATTKFLTLWDMKGQMIWTARIRSRCLLLASTLTELIGVTEHGRAMHWDTSSGELLEEVSFPHKSPADSPSGLPRAPGFAALCPDRAVLALAYSSGPVCLWDFQDNEFLDFAVDEKDASVDHLLFSPKSDVAMLLVAYSGSTLALYDSWSGALIYRHYPEKDTNYHSVACSPDGSLVATIDVLGDLRIWDFETLTPLYEVQTPPSPLRILGFTLDGANVVDVDGSDVRIWSPASLVRKKIDEDE